MEPRLKCDLRKNIPLIWQCMNQKQNNCISRCRDLMRWYIKHWFICGSIQKCWLSDGKARKCQDFLLSSRHFESGTVHGMTMTSWHDHMMMMHCTFTSVHLHITLSMSLIHHHHHHGHHFGIMTLGASQPPFGFADWNIFTVHTLRYSGEVGYCFTMNIYNIYNIQFYDRL
jgi:hypothetical protein